MKFKTTFLLSALFATIASASFASSKEPEDKVFDHYRTTPTELMLNFYDRSQVLVLGSSGHDNATVFENLKILLSKIGNDPRLKYIALEGTEDLDQLFPLLSTQDLDAALEKVTFTSPEVRQAVICSPQIAYEEASFFPALQRTNLQRPINRPIEAINIDGDWFQIPVDMNFNTPIEDRTCHLEAGLKGGLVAYKSQSGNREKKTAENFESRVLARLKPGEKAIVVYQHGHLIQSFLGCQPVSDDQGNWYAEMDQFNWLSRAISKNPALRNRMKIILFDEIGDSQNPNGMFKFSVRQANRIPGQDFAIRLAPFSKTFKEEGLSVFMNGANMLVYHQGKNYSHANLSAMFDGLVWSDSASTRFRIQTAHDYLPQYCPSIHAKEE